MRHEVILDQTPGNPISQIMPMTGVNPFFIPAILIGRITYLGPSINEIIGDLDIADQWEARLQMNFSTMLITANRESERLKTALRTMSPENLEILNRTIFNHNATNWSDANIKRQDLFRDYDSFETFTHNQRVSSSRLYQMRHRNLDIPWKMGLVPSNAEAGDFIC